MPFAVACNQPCDSVCTSQQPFGAGVPREAFQKDWGELRSCGVDWIWSRMGSRGKGVLEAGILFTTGGGRLTEGDG